MRQNALVVDGIGRRFAWTEWGDADNPSILLCVHGLTRSGRDFDPIAESLSEHYRVVCVDVAGRGASDPIRSGDYSFPIYLEDVNRLLSHLQPRALDWLGTSMGGLIAIAYAVTANSFPIRRLVLNDVGPEVPKTALLRIADYVGRKWVFPDLESAEQHFRKAYAPFAFRSDADWKWFTRISVRPCPAGGFEPAYDPAIGQAFSTEPVNLWPLWNSLGMPVLVVRGELSDVLLPAVAERMNECHPDMYLHEVKGVGHAPSLLYQDEIEPICSWLTGARSGFLSEPFSALENPEQGSGKFTV